MHAGNAVWDPDGAGGCARVEVESGLGSMVVYFGAWVLRVVGRALRVAWGTLCPTDFHNGLSEGIGAVYCIIWRSTTFGSCAVIKSQRTQRNPSDHGWRGVELAGSFPLGAAIEGHHSLACKQHPMLFVSAGVRTLGEKYVMGT